MATKSKISRKAPASKAKALKAKPAPQKAVKKTPAHSAKKPVPKKAAKKPAPKKAVQKPAPKKAVQKPAPKKVVQKPAPKKVTQKPAPKKAVKRIPPAIKLPPIIVRPPKKPVVLTGFLAKQRGRLLVLKDTLLDSMNGVAKDSLRSRADGSEASAFGMHQADAGSDAYDRDFALSLLSQEQDSLYEIDEALKRCESGAYGICEASGKPIPHNRLEALPFTRYTVECQADIEKRARHSRTRQPITSLFGLGEDESAESDDDDSSTDSKE